MYAVINMNDIKCQDEILRRQEDKSKGRSKEKERGSRSCMLGDWLES